MTLARQSLETYVAHLPSGFTHGTHLGWADSRVVDDAGFG